MIKSLIEDSHFLDIMNSDIDNDVDIKTGFYDNRCVYNSLIVIDGKNFRERVELLMVQGDAVFIAKGKNGLYELPGGSAERDRSDLEQVISECEEEAYITPKNVKYITSYKVEWDDNDPMSKHMNMNKNDIKYHGMYCKVYFGEYGSESRRYINIEDRDDNVRGGKFIKIKNVIKIMNPVHKKILQDYLNRIK